MKDDVPFPSREIVERGVEKGIEWFLYKNRIGAINGYVKLPEGHKWFGLSYDDVPVKVHGGLTYGGSGSKFIGFDTNHGGDYWENGDDYFRLFAANWVVRVWDQDQVVKEVKHLARQVAKNVSLWRKVMRFFEKHNEGSYMD